MTPPGSCPTGRRAPTRRAGHPATGRRRRTGPSTSARGGGRRHEPRYQAPNRCRPPHHYTALASHIPRAAGVAGRMTLAHPHAVAHPEAGLVDVGTGVSHRRREHRAAQRKPPAGAPLELCAGHQPMLDSQGSRRGQPVLVVAGRQVVAWLHPLNRVPELAPAGLDRAGDNRHQRPGDRLPPVGEGRLGRRMNHRPEALHATQVMDAVHQQDFTRPCSRQPPRTRGVPGPPTAGGRQPQTAAKGVGPSDLVNRRLQVPEAPDRLRPSSR
jgi:hypothetical protein